MNDIRTEMELSFISFKRYAYIRKLGPTMWNPRSRRVEKALLPLYPITPNKTEKEENHST
jgi:hypothetical protein